MRNKKVLFLTQAAVIAAIYVVLTIFISAFNLASGAIQVRISEALTILPFFTPAAIPGLAIGCLLSNLLTGAAVYDVVFGSLATLLGAVGTYLLRKHKFLSTNFHRKSVSVAQYKWNDHHICDHRRKRAQKLMFPQ